VVDRPAPAGVRQSHVSTHGPACATAGFGEGRAVRPQMMYACTPRVARLWPPASSCWPPPGNAVDLCTGTDRCRGCRMSHGMNHDHAVAAGGRRRCSQ